MCKPINKLLKNLNAVSILIYLFSEYFANIFFIHQEKCIKTYWDMVYYAWKNYQ